MSYVLTFVASDTNKPLRQWHYDEARKIAQFYNLEMQSGIQWLCKDKAFDIAADSHPNSILLMHLRDMVKDDCIDVFASPAGSRTKKLFLADMDSTIVTGETLDELAAHAGIKEQIAEITQLAMTGKLDFIAALKERVALLKNLEETALQDTLSKIRITPGAQILVDTMKQYGALCVLVSGGFKFFTSAVAGALGFNHHHGNDLEIAEGKLTGRVIEPVLDQYAKINFLKQYAEEQALDYKQTLAIGDGANDLPMLKKAGLGIGFRPKEIVAKEIPNLILYGDLTAALYAQGFKEKEFVRT